MADLALLIVLLVASFVNSGGLVRIFGLTHGIVFLALIAILGIWDIQKLWSWWFLVATLITTGPPLGVLWGKSLINALRSLLGRSLGLDHGLPGRQVLR